MLKTETRLFGRVSISWQLGELYVKLGQQEKARPYLDFVIQNGNTTRYVVQAEALSQTLL